MSEQEQEQTQEQEPDAEPGAQPEEHSSGMEAADRMQEELDEEESHEPEVEPEPEPPEGLSQKQLEQAFGKLERETERHGKRVTEIMGDDAAMLVSCPLCDPLIPGFVMPTPATPDRFPEVRAFIGDAQPEDWQPDPNAQQCGTCHGHGMVETGSKVPGQERLVCESCDGKGWTGQRATLSYKPPPPPALVAGDNGESRPAPAGIEPPEAAALRAAGYTLIPPVGASS